MKSKRYWEATLRFSRVWHDPYTGVNIATWHAIQEHQALQRQSQAHCNRWIPFVVPNGQLVKSTEKNSWFYFLIWIYPNFTVNDQPELSIHPTCILSLIFLCETKSFARTSWTRKLPGWVKTKLMAEAVVCGSIKSKLPNSKSMNSNSFFLNLMASFPINSGGTGSTSSPRSSSGLAAVLGISLVEPLLLRTQYEGFRQKKGGCGMPYLPDKKAKKMTRH